jgi:hypothetical protein
MGCLLLVGGRAGEGQEKKTHKKKKKKKKICIPVGEADADVKRC